VTEIAWSRPALTDMRRLDRQVAARITATLERYAETGQGDVRQLEGAPRWRLRVGDWRVIFVPRTETRAVLPPATGVEQIRVIEISRVLPRGRAYRN
jgi:mRNA interferase RelE/StbE